MSLEATSSCARVVTLRTTERLLTRMSQQVCLENTNLCAREATLIALERLFSRMFPHVPLKIKSFCAGVLALVATVALNCILQRFFRNFCHLTSNSNANLYGVIFKVEGKLISREIVRLCLKSESNHNVRTFACNVLF